MCRLKRHVNGFLRAEDGPTTVEYAIMLSMIIFVALAAVGQFGTTVAGMFETVKLPA